MSISTLQEKFFNKGCFTAGIVAISVAMAVSMFTRGGGAFSNRDKDAVAGDAIVTVGGLPVTASMIQDAASRLQAEAQQKQAQETNTPIESLGPPDALSQSLALVKATSEVLQKAAIQSLVRQSPVTEAEITAVALGTIEQGIQSAKDALAKQGKLKANATDAEVEAALKDSLKGKTLAQIRAEAPKDLLAQFKDPTKREAVIASYAGPILVQRLGEKAVGSDADLRAAYRSYNVRRIFLSAASGSKDSIDARVAKIQADLKAGKSFESEMDAMSNDPPPAGKKVHDSVEVLTGPSLAARPELASLKGQAANATTPIVDVPGGKAIYQLVSVQDSLPPDFEKDKEKLRAERIRTLGEAEATKQIKALTSGPSVKWQSLGYKALAAVGEAAPQGFSLDPVTAKAAVDAGMAALKSADALDRKMGAQALLAITDPQTSLGQKSPESAANRKIALEAAVANGVQDSALSLELAGIYGDAKDGAKATAALIEASKANADYGAKGQRTFGDIAGKALDLQKKNVLTKEQLESVQAQQAAWTATRAENEKAAAQAKLEAAKQKAANDAELARQQAEAGKTAGPRGAVVPSDAAIKKANAEEIARQKAEAAKKAAPAGGGSLLPTTAGSGR